MQRHATNDQKFFFLLTLGACLFTVAMSKDMIVFCHSGAFDWY